MKKFLFGLIAGLSAGMLFAPKTGKKLREQLRKSDTAFADFGNVFLLLAKDAGGELKTVLDSDEVQKVLSSGKKSAEDFANILETKGGDLSKKAQEELDVLIEKAVKKTAEAKKSTKKIFEKGKKKAGDHAKKAISSLKKTISSEEKKS